MGKREASHFITEYYTEGGKVELMIPTDATYDDFALLKDILAIVETKLKQRADRNSSEKPNNCEHITEDGVTCAKYPACDDCLDNPLNKVKGSKRLVKGSEEETEMEHLERIDNELEDARARIRELTDEPQTCSVNGRPYDCGNCEYFRCTADEPQTERSK